MKPQKSLKGRRSKAVKQFRCVSTAHQLEHPITQNEAGDDEEDVDNCLTGVIDADDWLLEEPDSLKPTSSAGVGLNDDACGQSAHTVEIAGGGELLVTSSSAWSKTIKHC